MRSSRSTLCLASALSRHGLCDELSAAPDIALPRGTRAPATAARIAWHWFNLETFEIGRQELRLDPRLAIGIYSAERGIIDAYRTRGLGHHQLANDALKRWLRRRDSQPSTLLQMAKRFPRALTPLRTALEILL